MPAWLTRIVNLWRPLEANGLKNGARRAVMLESFGEPPVAENLERLTESLKTEAGLSRIGRIATVSNLFRMLEYRLRIEADIAERPEIGREAIRAPLFIVGLPRTGTTLLHNLMACDPANRVPQTWEVMHPAPPPEKRDYDSDSRIARTQREIERLDRLVPEFKRIHEVDARLPQECIAITGYCFESYVFQTMYRVPAYQRWLEGQPADRRYRFHRRFLQYLQSGYAARRWVLKAPAHLFALRALFDVYPDAGIIQTHRDPKTVIASVASLTEVLRGAFSRRLDRDEIGREMAERWCRAIEEGMAAREALTGKQSRFFDLDYHEFVADPIDEIARLYDHFGLELNVFARKRMEEFLAANPKEKHGKHHYSLSRYGLAGNAIEARLSPYCERYGIRGEEAD